MVRICSLLKQLNYLQNNMKVILLKTIPKIGKKDEIVEVNVGYANNSLLPQKLAIPATPAAVAAMKAKQQHKIAEKEIQHNLLDRAISELAGKSLVVKAKANDKGNLFSKIDGSDIALELLKQCRISIDPNKITIEAPIKHTGSYAVKVSDGEYRSTFTVDIVGE